MKSGHPEKVERNALLVQKRKRDKLSYGDISRWMVEEGMKRITPQRVRFIVRRELARERAAA